MKRIYLMMPLLLTSFSWQANSASVSGTIDVSINLVQGCVINGNNAVDTASGIGLVYLISATCQRSLLSKMLWSMVAARRALKCSVATVLLQPLHLALVCMTEV